MFKTDRRILLTGGSGALGSCIRRLVECFAPDSSELDITDFKKCRRAIKKYDPDIIIHTAAYVKVAEAENNKRNCWDVNVKGTENMVKATAGCRFVYISTEYVFDGKQVGYRVGYREDDIPNPVNFYSLTKLLGETIVRQYQNTLVIRTAFKKDGPWPYPRAFVDQWMGVDFASERAPDIVKAALMENLTGLIHISGERKTIYQLAKKVSPQVGKISIKEAPVKLPRDTSLNSDLWKKILSESIGTLDSSGERKTN